MYKKSWNHSFYTIHPFNGVCEIQRKLTQPIPSRTLVCVSVYTLAEIGAPFDSEGNRRGTIIKLGLEENIFSWLIKRGYSDYEEVAPADENQVAWEAAVNHGPFWSK